MSVVSYNGQKLIPAPLVSISKDYQTTGDGRQIGAVFSIVVQGTMVAWKGSPNSDGVFHTTSGYPADEDVSAASRLASIITKQQAIRALFSTHGLSFEVQSADGSQPLKCNPRILRIEVPEGQWYETAPYTITMEADRIYPLQEDNFSEYISSAEENWTIETNEVPENEHISRTYNLSHTVAAQGKRFYDETGTLVKPAWQQARTFVLGRLGFDSQIALSSGVNNLPSYYGGYNHLRSQTLDEEGGSFSVTETWILTSGTALEEFTVSKQTSLQDGLDRVTIEGNITGLEQRTSDLVLSTSKYTNALAKFATASGLAFSRAQTYSNSSLNIIPNGQTIGRNPVAGTINYSFEYDNRPSNIISGCRSELISIFDTMAGDVFATIPILGRRRGPLLQDINTVTPTEKSLTIELFVDRANFGNNTLTDIKNAFNNNPRVNPATSGQFKNIVDAANPGNNGFSTVFTNPPQETWQPKTGQYSYSVSWVYQ
jgi:hypothetical protein